METFQNSKKQTALDRRNDVLPCVTSVKVPPLPRKINLTDCSWPFIGSFAIHAVFIAIISCPSFQYPIVTGSDAATTFWFSTLSPPDNLEERVKLPSVPSAAFAAQRETSVNEPARQSPDSTDDPVQADYQETGPETIADVAEPEITIAAPAPVKKAVETAESPKPPPDAPRRKTPVPAPIPPPRPIPKPAPPTPLPAPVQVKHVTTPLEPEPESPRALPAIQPAMTKVAESRSPDNEKSPQNEADRISRQIIEQNQLAAEKLRREQIAMEQELRASREKIELERAAVEKARQKQQAAEKLRRAQELRAIQDRLDSERAAAEKARQIQQAEKRELQKRINMEEAQRRKDMERVASAKAERNLPTVVPAVPRSPELPVTARATEKVMSVSLPVIKGDLKLIISGTNQPETIITFTDFARSRRDRPLSRAESRRHSRVVPLIAKRSDSSREVVISQANAGVYAVTAVAAGESAAIAISMKLYEGTSRAVSRELGKHIVTGRKVLLKILMPEGILWDDDSAFSGNMEDSDGVTKFNAQTGLMWKEYSD